MVKSLIKRLQSKGELNVSEIQKYINMQQKLLDNPQANLSDERRLIIKSAIEKAQSLLSPQSGEGQGSSGTERQ